MVDIVDSTGLISMVVHGHLVNSRWIVHVEWPEIHKMADKLGIHRNPMTEAGMVRDSFMRALEIDEANDA